MSFEREQLFNLKEDPIEERDLAKDSVHAEKLAEMRARFATVFEREEKGRGYQTRSLCVRKPHNNEGFIDNQRRTRG